MITRVIIRKKCRFCYAKEVHIEYDEDVNGSFGIAICRKCHIRHVFTVKKRRLTEYEIE